MNDIEDLLRRSFAERSTEIVASPDLLDRIRSAGPEDRSRLRRPLFQAVGAAAAVVAVVVSAWIATRAGQPSPAAPPGNPAVQPTAPVTSEPAPPTHGPPAPPTGHPPATRDDVPSTTPEPPPTMTLPTPPPASHPRSPPASTTAAAAGPIPGRTPTPPGQPSSPAMP